MGKEEGGGEGGKGGGGRGGGKGEGGGEGGEGGGGGGGGEGGEGGGAEGTTFSVVNGLSLDIRYLVTLNMTMSCISTGLQASWILTLTTTGTTRSVRPVRFMKQSSNTCSIS